MQIISNGIPIEVLGKQGIRGMAGPDGNPIGTVISYMGKTAPKDYLICDGAVLPIANYPKLADFFEEQFGAKDHFGGDGVTDFAVPTISGSGDLVNCIKATEAEPYENVYSEEEQIVGRWIDGKPIYRMVYEANVSVSYNNPKTVCTIKNLEKLIDCHIFGESSDGTHCIAPSHGFSIETNSGGTVVVTMGMNWAARFVKNSYFIIEYTKTTDEPAT